MELFQFFPMCKLLLSFTSPTPLPSFTVTIFAGRLIDTLGSRVLVILAPMQILWKRLHSPLDGLLSSMETSCEVLPVNVLHIVVDLEPGVANIIL